MTYAEILKQLEDELELPGSINEVEMFDHNRHGTTRATCACCNFQHLAASFIVLHSGSATYIVCLNRKACQHRMAELKEAKTKWTEEWKREFVRRFTDANTSRQEG